MDRAELLKIAKPVLFNTQMVIAILEGRKTVTRRIIKKLSDGVNRIEEGDFGTYEAIFGRYNNGCFAEMYQVITPQFQAGDYLYVRETWTDPTPDQSGYPILYMADMPMRWEEDDVTLKAEDYKWRPSIHMPKEAARLFLKVKDVRVERLQDITPREIEREGLKNPCEECYAKRETCEDCICRDEYVDKLIWSELWNSTIKKADLDKYGWEANPWVWVIEFERVEVE